MTALGINYSVGSALLIAQHVFQTSEAIQDLPRALLLHLYARGLNTGVCIMLLFT